VVNLKLRALWRGVLLAATGLSQLAACGPGGPQADTAARVAPRPVVAQTLSAARLSSGFQTTGIVEADKQIDLAFRVGGFVDKIHVEEGDRVGAGDLLIELDRRDVQRQLDLSTARRTRAQANLTEAQAEYARQSTLRENNQTSERDYQQAESRLGVAAADLQEAEVQLAVAQDQLSDSVLRAPISGHIQSRMIELHEYAEPRTPVLGLVSMERVKIRATVPDRYAHLIVPGAGAEVWLNDGRARILRGTITLIGVAADPETRAIPFEVTVANPDFELRPDTVASIRVTSPETQEGVLVPLVAVLRDVGLQPFCFVVSGSSGDLRVERREIELDGLQGDRVGVVAGLSPGEQIVVEGQHFLAQGDPIVLIEAAGDD